MSLQGQYAVVTGGGSGIGKGVAVALAQAGAKVTICGRREAVLDEVVAEYPSLSLDKKVLDISDRVAVDAFFEKLHAEVGAPDILVNSAGINIPNRSMGEMNPEQWDQIISVNATGAYNCFRAALPAMRAKGNGLIVNISSVAGKRAQPMAGVAYAASKFAATALGTSVGLEEAKHGIRVSNIYPGEVDTPLLEQRTERVPEEKRARMVKPEDVGQVVRLMAELPQTTHIPEIVIKPLYQEYM